MRFINIEIGDFPKMAIAMAANQGTPAWSTLESRARQVLYVCNPNKPWQSTKIRHSGYEVGSILSYARYTVKPDTWEKIFNIPAYTYTSPQHALNAVLPTTTYMYAPRWGTHYTTQRETLEGIDIAIRGGAAGGKIQFAPEVKIGTFRALRNSSEAGGNWDTNAWASMSVSPNFDFSALLLRKSQIVGRLSGDIMLELPAGDPYVTEGDVIRMTDDEITSIRTRQDPNDARATVKLQTTETIVNQPTSIRFWTPQGETFREVKVTANAIRPALTEYTAIKDALVPQYFYM